MWTQCARAFAGILFPQTCAGCDGILANGSTDFCDVCGPKLAELVGLPCCARCGRTLAPYVSPDNICPLCRTKTPLTDGLVRVGPYDGPIESMIRHFKFHARYHLERTAVRLLAARLESAPWREDLDSIVPVPTHWSRRSIRGEYLADRLARGVARACGLRYRSALRRIRGGPNQYELTTAAERAANVRGAFSVARGARLKGARICLVDDISTTGATLAEVRRVLHNAGAAKCYAAILAKAG